MNSKRETESAVSASRSDASLDLRYGRIGISAVVAAMQYCPEKKNPAYAPAPVRSDNWTAERAA